MVEIFLHFVPYDKKFVKTIITIIRYFEENEHKIVVYGRSFSKEGADLPSDETLLLGMKENRKRIKELIDEAEGILFHGIFRREIILFLLFHQKILEKSNWIAWGADIYSKGGRGVSLKGRIALFLQGLFASKFKFFTTLVEQDYEVAVKKYGIKGTHLRCIYATGETDELEEIFQEQIRSNERSINIHVGNSASYSNEHKDIFNSLAKFRNENIRVYVPLSYGNHAYAKKVEKMGQEIFGEKFFPLLQMMNSEDYSRHLSKMHIGLFNNNRQQGLGNIRKLLFFGAKVYLRTDTSMWENLINEGDYRVYDIRRIGEVGFQEFADFPEEKALHNKTQFLKHRTKKNVVDIWQKVFDSMRDNIRN